MGQVVEFSRANLRNPYIHLSTAVRKKRHEMAVGGNCGGLLRGIEVRNCWNRAGRWISPEVLRPPQPDACGNNQNHGHRTWNQPPRDGAGDGARRGTRNSSRKSPLVPRKEGDLLFQIP